MILDPHSRFPAVRGYVLKLHRDAEPEQLAGRLEHISSGRQYEFAGGAELLRLLSDELERVRGGAGAD